MSTAALAIVLLAAADGQLVLPATGRLAPAVSEAVTAAYREADGAEAVGRYGMVLLAHHLNSEARVAFTRAVELAEPQSQGQLQWRYLESYTLQLMGELDAALAGYDELLAQRPQANVVLLRRAEAYITQGRLEEAAADLRSVGERWPRAAAVPAGLGRVAYLEGDYRAAVRYLSDALALAPDADRLHHTLGLAYRRLGERELAREHIGQAGETNVGIPDPLMAQVRELSRSVQSLIERATRLLTRGEAAQAVQAYRAALDAEPGDPSAMTGLALALEESGRISEAEAQFLETIRINPEYPQARHRYGVLLARLARLDEAMTRYREALAMNPDYIEAGYQLASTLMIAGRPSEAAAVIRDLIALRPDNLFVRNQLALALLAAGDCGALDETRETVQRAPQRGDVRLRHLRAVAACVRDPATLASASDGIAAMLQRDQQPGMLEVQALLLAARGLDAAAVDTLGGIAALDADGRYASVVAARIASLEDGRGAGDPLPLEHPLTELPGNEARRPR